MTTDGQRALTLTEQWRAQTDYVVYDRGEAEKNRWWHLHPPMNWRFRYTITGPGGRMVGVARNMKEVHKRIKQDQLADHTPYWEHPVVYREPW